MKKKIAFDMALNIVATAIPIIVLQLFLLPALSHYLSDDQYGLLVTILSLMNMVPSTLGNVLNNIRLIESRELEDGNAQQNFNVILSVMLGVNLVTMAVCTCIYDRGIEIDSLLLTLLVSVFLLLREYFTVAFRIKLNYKNIVASNLIMIAGYGVGFFLFPLTNRWQVIYLLGYGFSLAFIFLKTDLWKEAFQVSSSFRHICLQAVLLTAATFLGRVTTYADKLIIFPVLGGAVVSVYYTATLFGKVVSMAITPISSVILSYLSRANRKNDDIFRLAFFSGLGVCIVGYFACIAVSRPVLGLLYPQFVEQAMQYIWITTGTMVITTLTAIVHPFVLKFFDMKWQILINGSYVAVYVGLALTMLGRWGLHGFCLGALAASLIKLVFMVYIYGKKKEKAF